MKTSKGPSNAPLPSFIVPLPSLSVPSHTADPVRVAIVLSPLLLSYARIRACISAEQERNLISASRANECVLDTKTLTPLQARQLPVQLWSAGSVRVLRRPAARCLRPSQMLRAHQIAPIGTATQEMPTSPKPNHRING